MTEFNALGPTTFGHDAAGNTTTYAISGLTGFLYSYDSFNRISSFTQGATSIGSYTYNGKGERVGKAVASGTPVRFVFGEDQRLLAERQDGTAVWTNYLWFGNALVGLVRANVPTYLATDQAGRPELGTNVSRVVVWNSNNAPFEGQSLSVNDIGPVNIGYPGQYYEEAGLYNLNREYDASYGRYTQADPIGLAGGINPYVYAGNNPVSNVDPRGTLFGADDFAEFVVWSAIVGGVSSGVTTYAVTGSWSQALAATGTGAFSGAVAGVLAAGSAATALAVGASVVLDVAFDASISANDAATATGPLPVPRVPNCP